ncbi:ABC transporter substrate-binding protein [Pelistega indica]|uniref:ABC transporter substrate-binding protein n=1 Tax=Pelistega indica TaxID=1414851 RepID=UPI0003FE3B3C|nr:ABC transporter substrate-binding protein [Pelistega indica]
MKALFFRTVAATVMGLAAISVQAVEVQTAHGNVKFDKPLSDNIAVYDVGALDSITALGITPKGTSDAVGVSYLQDVYKQSTKVGTLFEPDLEKLNALKPEAAFIGGRMSPKYEEIQKVVPVVDMSNPKGVVYNISRTKEVLTEYGKLFAKEDKAAELNKNLDEELEKTKQLTQGKKDVDDISQWTKSNLLIQRVLVLDIYLVIWDLFL